MTYKRHVNKFKTAMDLCIDEARRGNRDQALLSLGAMKAHLLEMIMVPDTNSMPYFRAAQRISNILQVK